jgi:hypothetical protein
MNIGHEKILGVVERQFSNPNTTMLIFLNVSVIFSPYLTAADGTFHSGRLLLMRLIGPPCIPDAMRLMSCP